MKHILSLSFAFLLSVSPLLSLNSKDAYVIRKGGSWTLGTAKVKRTIRLADGKFFTDAWEDKTNGRDLLPRGPSGRTGRSYQWAGGPGDLGRLEVDRRQRGDARAGRDSARHPTATRQPGSDEKLRSLSGVVNHSGVG